MRFVSILLAVSLLLIVIEQKTLSQEQNTPTLTPAPTKTPEGPNTENSETENGEVESITEPFTQSDLTVLIGNVLRPNGLVWHENNLYTACNGDWTLYEIESTTGSTRTYIQGIRNAHTLYAETLDNGTLDLWIPDYEQNSLMLVSNGRFPQTIAGDLAGPWGIAYLDEESFLITNLTGNTVNRISRSGEVTELLSGMRSPTGIATEDEFVYIANNGSARRSIEWISTEELLNEEEPSTQPLASGLQNVTALTMADDGYLYFAYALGTRGVVGRLDPEFCRENGGCSNDQIEIVLYTELAAPLAGLTISPDMRLFVHTMFRPEIYWLQLDSEAADASQVQSQ